MSIIFCKLRALIINTHYMRKITILLLTMALSVTAFAGGYQVRLQGAKQTGMGLIGAPLGFGASTIFYNPGAMSFMEKNFEFELGASAIFANVAFQKSNSNYQAEMDNSPSTPFYFYFAARASKLVSLGVGVYTPFGSSATWADDWAGNLLVQNIALQAIYVQPTVSFNINDKLGLGVGFIYAYGSFELNRALNYSGGSSVQLQGSGSNFGYNLGLYFKPVENWSIGVNYRSKVMMEVTDGDATFNIPQSLQGTIPTENKFSSELPLPASLDVGVAVQATEKFKVAIEFDWIWWNVYDTLSFTFEQAGDILDSNNPREYSLSFIPRLGLEYAFNKTVVLRVGGYYDPTPTNANYFSPETVSLNTIAYTVGLSIMPADGLSIDISWLQLFGQKSDKMYQPDNFGGTYQTATIAPGLGISYSF